MYSEWLSALFVFEKKKKKYIDFGISEVKFGQLMVCLLFKKKIYLFN